MVNTFLRGTGRQRENVLSAHGEITLLFKQMIDDVERNQANQVRSDIYGIPWRFVTFRSQYIHTASAKALLPCRVGHLFLFP